MSNKKLPVVKTIEYSLPLPLSKKNLIFRPYSVADEKILMAGISQKEKDPEFYVRNTLNVLKTTILNDIDLDSLPSAEVELFQMHLKGKSSGEEIEFSFSENKKKINVTVNTDNFYISEPDADLMIIEITPEVFLKMKYLNFSKRIEYASMFKDTPTDSIFETVVDCIDAIYNPKDDSEIWKVGEDISIDETRDFIFGLSGHSEKLYKFIRGLPRLMVEATLDDGTTRNLDSNDIDFLS